MQADVGQGNTMTATLFARITVATMAVVSLTATGCDLLVGDGIGPDGGVIVSEDGRMALEIPAGALDETVELTIERVPGPEGAASALYMVEPMGLVLQRPAAIVFDYDDETLEGRDAEALTLLAHREADWAYLGDQLVDDDDQTVSASMIALSPVTVVIDD